MKRIAIAALAALTAVSFAACGNKDKNDGSGRVKKLPVTNTTDSEDIAQTGSKSDKAAEDGSVTEQTPAESNDEKVVIELVDPDEEDGSDKTEPDESEEKDEDSHSLFTFNADEKLWVTEKNRNSTSLIYNGDDVEFAKGNCTILINNRVIEDMPDRTLGEVADAIIDSKGLTDFVEVQSRGESVLGGHDAYTLSCVYTVNSVNFDLDVTVMAEGTDVLEVWVMSYEECTAAMQDNFDEVLRTISFGQ